MSGKRKRTENAAIGAESLRQGTTTGKPLSAIAAARLRAETAAQGIITPEVTKEPVSVPSTLLESPESDQEESEPEEEPITIQRNFKLCNWKGDAQNTLSDTNSELTINLKKHATIALIGSFDLKVLRGAVNINGANIGAVTREGQKARVYRTYVPATHPITKIRALDGKNHVQFLSCKEPTPFTKISPLFRDIWNARLESGKDRSFSVITESEADPLDRFLTPELTPEDHLRAIEDIVSNPSNTLITGPPSTGKSVFARRLINRYLTGLGKNAHPVPAVCYLDLDPLKPEYTPHGQISLVVVRELNLGPNFTHPTTIPGAGADANETIRAHPIPVNLANYQDYYQQCIEDLFLTYKGLSARDPSLPLVVNTPGSLYTTNLPLLNDLLTRIKPHHIVTLTDPTTALPSPTLSKPVHTTLHTLNSITHLAPPLRTDAQLQAMHTQSYFHLSAPAHWSATPLTHTPPWILTYASPSPSLSAILSLTDPLPPSSLIHALNGSLVYIVTTSAPSAPLPRTPRSEMPFFPTDAATGAVAPPDPRVTRLVCLALVRGLEPGEGVVQVLVPRAVEGVMWGLEGGRTVGVLGCCAGAEWAVVEGAEGEISSGKEIVRGDGGAGMWVERREVMEGMGYLNAVRRVRKFMV